MLTTLTRQILSETFALLRSCGGGTRECQVFLTGPVNDPYRITRAVLSQHSCGKYWLEVDSAWLTKFWILLGEQQMSVRVQVHTHAGAAFHSETDDKWPVVATLGFLSLVIPRFAMGPIELERAFLAELGVNGFQEVDIRERVQIV
jgi:hypothetical protein